MTVSLKVHVNGNYRATVKHTANGVDQPDVVVGPQEEKPVYIDGDRVTVHFGEPVTVDLLSRIE